jgi:hypothetical protein
VLAATPKPFGATSWLSPMKIACHPPSAMWLEAGSVTDEHPAEGDHRDHREGREEARPCHGNAATPLLMTARASGFGDPLSPRAWSTRLCSTTVRAGSELRRAHRGSLGTSRGAGVWASGPGSATGKCACGKKPDTPMGRSGKVLIGARRRSVTGAASPSCDPRATEMMPWTSPRRIHAEADYPLTSSLTAAHHSGGARFVECYVDHHPEDHRAQRHDADGDDDRCRQHATNQ